MWNAINYTIHDIIYYHPTCTFFPFSHSSHYFKPSEWKKKIKEKFQIISQDKKSVSNFQFTFHMLILLLLQIENDHKIKTCKAKKKLRRFSWILSIKIICNVVHFTKLYSSFFQSRYRTRTRTANNDIMSLRPSIVKWSLKK